jgi:phytoene synthase
MAETPPRALAERLALVFTPAAQRAPLAALAEVAHEIRASARTGIDHGVAHARLEWWRGEIERLAAGTPRHPATRRLHAAAGPGPAYARLAETLAAAELTLVGYAPDGEAELLAHLDRTHGALETLAAELAAGRADPALATHARALGRGLGLAAAVASGDLRWLAAVPADQVRRLARAALEEALALAPPFAAAQLHGLVRARLALAILDRRGGAPPALRQWWLAWRTARRALGSMV